jgi:hypothetical protein
MVKGELKESKKPRLLISLLLICSISFSLVSVCARDVHVFDTEPIEGGEWFWTNERYSSLRLRGISVGLWAPAGWKMIPEGWAQTWQVKFRALFNDPVVDHIEVRIWIPESDGELWENTLSIHSADPFPPGHVQTQFWYEGAGWYVYQFDAPEGEYFRTLSSGEPTLLHIQFHITNPPTLEPGTHNLVKILYCATGNFEGVEKFTWAQGDENDPLGLYFYVGHSFSTVGYGGEIWTTDEDGNEKTQFKMHDTVYLSSNVEREEYYTTQPLYIVDDRDWSDGDLLSGYQRYGLQEVLGSRNPQPIWTPQSSLKPGSYNVIIDVDGNGKFSPKWDVILGFRVSGFFVIPEYALGTLAPILTAFIVIYKKRINA